MAEEKNKTFKELQKTLVEKIPEEALTEYTQDGKTFNGYQSQYAINLLNEKVGYNSWDFNVDVLDQGQDNKGYYVAMNGKLTIKCEDQLITHTGSGGAYAKDIANAYKGARTSCFKNACRYFGIGKELYEKGVDEDIVVEDTPVVKVELTGDAVGLEKKIATSVTTEQLKTLEEPIKALKEKGIVDVLLKQYNAKKLDIISK